MNCEYYLEIKIMSLYVLAYFRLTKNTKLQLFLLSLYEISLFEDFMWDKCQS